MIHEGFRLHAIFGTSNSALLLIEDPASVSGLSHFSLGLISSINRGNPFSTIFQNIRALELKLFSTCSGSKVLVESRIINQVFLKISHFVSDRKAPNRKIKIPEMSTQNSRKFSLAYPIPYCPGMHVDKKHRKNLMAKLSALELVAVSSASV